MNHSEGQKNCCRSRPDPSARDGEGGQPHVVFVITNPDLVSGQVMWDHVLESWSLLGVFHHCLFFFFFLSPSMSMILYNYDMILLLD